MPKILIIEDNDRNRMLLRDILGYHGYEVVEAVNGEEGIRMAREQKPDLILLDMQMPVMDGFDVAKTIKGDADLNEIKVITVTSFAMKGDRERILALGVDDYISKPIDTRALPEIVKKHVGPGKSR